MSPLVSVVMPFRDSIRYLPAAVESVLSQSHSNFELIALDDGSVDGGADVLRRYQDSRIKVLGDSRRLGITARLNEGLEIASGQFVARMDADDISLPHRFESQLRFFDANREVSVLGAAAAYIDENGRYFGSPRPSPLNDFAIKWRFITSNCIVHPSVMCRAQVLRENPYPRDSLFAQDYGLWLALASKGYVFANLPEVMILQRRHSGAVSFQERGRQKIYAARALQRYLETRFGILVSDAVGLSLVEPPLLNRDDEDLSCGPIDLLERLVKITLAEVENSRRAVMEDFLYRDICYYSLRYFLRSCSNFFLDGGTLDEKGLKMSVRVICSRANVLLNSLLSYASRRFSSSVQARRAISGGRLSRKRF